MRLFLTAAVVMFAFAANSLLNRYALLENTIDPLDFSLIRVASGALMLLILLAMRDQTFSRPPRPDILAVCGLVSYMLGFSLAYVSVDAGLGALVLFGAVQATMFAGALRQGEKLPALQWIGAGISMLGLCLLLWPSGRIDISIAAFSFMAAAGVGWGIYSLVGRDVQDPLQATAWNFAYALPAALLASFIHTADVPPQFNGILLAIIAGAVTSGLGYALWYIVLPQLSTTAAALSQLSVPVIAIVMGSLLLAEAMTIKSIMAAALVIGGIALGTMKSTTRAHS